MSSDAYRLVKDYSLEQYSCGLSAGTELSIKREIRVSDHTGKETEKIYPEGKVWTALPGVAVNPDFIWIR
jgi:hypothetical protein